MNQRRELRVSADQPVWITLLGEPDVRLPAHIKNVSARGIGLELDGPIATGTALKFELNDVLLLGEVIYCRGQDSSYYVGVELEQALCGLGDLASAVSVFARPPSGSQEAKPVTERRYQN